MDNIQIRGIYAGVWDFLHCGHLQALKYAKKYCDFLVGAINRDPTIDNPKKNKPIETVKERIERLVGCSYVDDILVYTGEEQLQEIYKSGIYQIAFISEEHIDTYTDCEPAKAVFVPKMIEMSSSLLRNRILEEETKK